MKTIVYCIGYVLMLTMSVHAQYWPGRFNNYSLGGNNRNGVGGGVGFGQMPLFSYNYNGFFYNNDGVNLSINTPWGGGSLSFPTNTLRNGASYTYNMPNTYDVSTTYNVSTFSSQGYYRNTPRRLRRVSEFEIDYSNPDLAINRNVSSTSIQQDCCVKVLHWTQKMVTVSIKKFSGSGTDGSVYQKTEIIQRLEWVLE